MNREAFRKLSIKIVKNMINDFENFSKNLPNLTGFNTSLKQPCDRLDEFANNVDNKMTTIKS